jgi:hypothetical protein
MSVDFALAIHPIMAVNFIAIVPTYRYDLGLYSCGQLEPISAPARRALSSETKRNKDSYRERPPAASLCKSLQPAPLNGMCPAGYQALVLPGLGNR